MRQPKQNELAPNSQTLNEIVDYFNTYYRQLNGPKHKHITIEQCRRKSRTQALVMCRMFVSYYLYYCCHWRMALIGYWLKRDHTTIVHAIGTFNDLKQVKDPHFMEWYDDLKGLFVTPADVPVDLFLNQYNQSTDECNRIQQFKDTREKELRKRLKLAERQLDKYIAKANELKKMLVA